MFYFLYDWFVWPLLRFGFGVAARFAPKIARGLELRLPAEGRAPWVKHLPPVAPTLWIHAASGEFEYAKPVITLLKRERPDVRVVVTFFSPTYADNIRKFAGVDWVVPLPWDTPRALGEFLSSYRPFALAVARTDVWPEMARQTRARSIASVLFSATLTPGSGRTRGLGRWLARETLDQLDEIFCVTSADVEAFRSLGLRHAAIRCEGDTRFDQVLARLAQPKAVKRFGADLFVCGSTWPEDEAVLIPAVASVVSSVVTSVVASSSDSSSVRTVLVPHEPTEEHVTLLEASLRAAGLIPVRYSANDAEERFTAPGTCLIVDQTGILAELYLQARWAFVGGSFKKAVHSVMEPLAAGCRTFVGPLHTNNREAVEFQTLKTSDGHGFVTCVRDADELAMELRAPQVNARTEIRAAVEARTGSSRKLVDWILSKI